MRPTQWLGNRLLTLTANVLYRSTLSDMETCYKLFDRTVLDAITIESDGFDFEPEITAKVLRRGYRIYEVPVSYTGRDASEGTKFTWRDGVRALQRPRPVPVHPPHLTAVARPRTPGPAAAAPEVVDPSAPRTSSVAATGLGRGGQPRSRRGPGPVRDDVARRGRRRGDRRRQRLVGRVHRGARGRRRRRPVGRRPGPTSGTGPRPTAASTRRGSRARAGVQPRRGRPPRGAWRRSSRCSAATPRSPSSGPGSSRPTGRAIRRPAASRRWSTRPATPCSVTSSPTNRFTRRYRLGYVDAEEVTDVDWVSGACFLARRRALEELRRVRRVVLHVRRGRRPVLAGPAGRVGGALTCPAPW